MNWPELAQRVLDGGEFSRDQAHAIIDSSDDELLPILHAAFQIRKKYFDRDVSIHVLRNAKSGVCSEDCSFCSQSVKFKNTTVKRYKMQSVDEIVAGARAAYEMNATRYCIVTATRGPSASDLDTVCEAVRQIKREMPISICTSLGMLDDDIAKRLADAGVNRFNHNLETSKNYFPEIVSTHSWEDRRRTIETAKRAGMEACCGGILGLGEDSNDRVALAFELKELGVDSIPVNFLDPRPGTPLADQSRMSPGDCLRALAMFRFVNPTRDIRIAGGREVNLRQMQSLALYPANSLFSQGYLTTGGQGAEQDAKMIADAGFVVKHVYPH